MHGVRSKLVCLSKLVMHGVCSKLVLFVQASMFATGHIKYASLPLKSGVCRKLWFCNGL
jgi:hypothetical protein